jgi:hypothetical protein
LSPWAVLKIPKWTKTLWKTDLVLSSGKKVGTGCCVQQLDSGWRPEHKWKCDVSYRLNTVREDKAGCNVNMIAPKKLESKLIFVTVRLTGMLSIQESNEGFYLVFL